MRRVLLPFPVLNKWQKPRASQGLIRCGPKVSSIRTCQGWCRAALAVMADCLLLTLRQQLQNLSARQHHRRCLKEVLILGLNLRPMENTDIYVTVHNSSKITAMP